MPHRGGVLEAGADVPLVQSVQCLDGETELLASYDDKYTFVCLGDEMLHKCFPR